MKQTFSQLSNKVISKLIAIVTSVCFIVTGVFVDFAQAVTIDKQEKKSIENTQTFITLPSIGLITEAIDFGSKDIIVNIQDLHSHSQTQRNISKIISHLDGKYKLNELFLEGAYGNVDTNWLSRMEASGLGKQVIEDLVDAGQLGGVEYYSAVNNKNCIIKGIEDKNIYEENIKLLNEIIDLQPEIDAICNQIEKEIRTVKKDYFNRDTDKLDKLVKRYKANKISANKYYEKLSKLAKKNSLDLDKYENVKAYIELLSQSKHLNLEKVSRQFKVFVNILKSNIEYSRYLELSKNSNNFQDIENILPELKDIAESNQIFEKHKLAHLKNFFTYLEFNGKVNLIEFVQEEKKLLNELYAKLSKNKYENEVAFLYEFAPTIKEYFSASITAEDYLKFKDDFKKFRVIWNSYFSENTSKQLYKYEQLLSKYHSNNIKRDEIFADKVAGTQNNNTNVTAVYGQSAISKLSNEINGKTIKVIVTGGFHSRGLEQIAIERKISYIQITPKITQDISHAGEIHWNTIRGYRQVLDNTINAKPLTETWLNVLFPEILTRALIATNEIPEFAQLNILQKKQLINEVIDEAIKARNTNDKITVAWTIEEFEENKAKIKATYTDQSDDKENKYDKEYIFNGKSLQTIGQNDTKKAPQKLNESTESVQSILNNFFNNTKTFWYKLYTTVIAPIWEEFVFRFIPFAIAGSLATAFPVSITAIAITAVVSIISFPIAHIISDKIFSKSGYEIRDFKNFVIPSVIFTSIYLIAAFAFPAIPFIGLIASIVAHSVYNAVIIISKNIIESGTKIKFKNIQNTITKISKLKLANIFDGTIGAEKIDVDTEIQQLIYHLDSLMKNNGSIMKKEYAEFLDTGHSLFSEIGDIREELNALSGLSKQDKYNSLSRAVNRLYDIMVVCALKNEGEEFGSSMLLAKLMLTYFYEISIYIRDNQGILLFDKIIDFAIKQKKMFIKHDTLRLDELIDTLYAKNPEIAKTVLKEAYDAGFFRDGMPILRSVNGFELAKFFYTTISDDGSGIIVVAKDEPLLSKEDLEYFVKNEGTLNDYNISLNDVISRLQYIQTLDVFQKNESIHEVTEKVLKTLKSASQLSREEKYKILNVQINYLVREFTKADVDVNIFRVLIPIALFIKNENGAGSLVVTVFDFVLEARLADKYARERTSSIISINKTDFLIETSSKIFSIDNKLGLSLLAKLKEKGFIDIQYAYNLSGWTRKDAYRNLSYGWENVIKTYADLELFYDTLGIDYEELNEKLSIYERLFYKSDYLRMLENMLPVNITEKIKNFSNPASYFRTKKHSAFKQIKDKESENKFEIFNGILENNILSLSELNRGNEDSLLDSIIFLERMIEGLKKFDNKYRPYGANAQKSLDAIKRKLKEGITPEIVAEQNKLNLWSVEKIDEVNNVHTLINAVHQTSISVFMNLIDEEIKKDSAKEVIVNPATNNLKIYDFSKNGMRPEVKDFLAKMSEANHRGVLYVSEGRVLYNKRLGAHSVSIFIDFDNAEESIVCTFYDSGRSDGNALRTTLLATLFALAGFDIISFDNQVANYNESTIGLCEVKAVWGYGNTDLRIGEHYSEFFSKAFSIVNNTKDLDYHLQGVEYDNDRNYYHKFAIPQLTLEHFKTIKKTKEFPQEVYNEYIRKSKELKVSAFFEQLKFRMNNLMIATKDEFNAIYDYFELEGADRNIETVEKMYVEGRIIKNSRGYLEINKNYKPMSNIIEIINGNEWARDMSFKQAQLLNLIDYSKIHFRTEGYIGGMIVKSGTIKLSDGWLSVKAVVDAERERMQCAFVEYVDIKGNRTELDYDELIKILQENGYEVEKQSERGSSEKKKTINTLHEQSPFMKETPTAKAVGLSLGSGGSVIGKVEYDETNLKQDSIWIAQQIMKESVERMDIPSGFCITSGGIYSHASIVAREKNKPAVLLQTKWVDNEIELRYYTYKGNVINEGGFFIRETIEHVVRIKAGDIVLINPETGEMLLFNGLNKIQIEELQKFIDEKNIQGLKQYLKLNETNPDIGKLIEYVYYQSAGTQKLKEILHMLVAWEHEDKIGEKIDKLNAVYKQNKLKKLQDVVDNTGNTEDIKESYVLIKTAEEQINNIILRKPDTDIETLKNKISEKKREILVEYVRYIEGFKLTVDKLMKKNSLTNTDMNIAVKLVEMSKYWKYFYGYKGIRELTEALDKKIHDNFITGGDKTTLDEEIKTFNQISSVDKLKFGSKTTELAKINNSGRDFGILSGIGIGSGVIEIFFKDSGRFEEYKMLMQELESIIKSKNMLYFDRAVEIAKQISKMIHTSDSTELKEYIDNFTGLKDGKRYAVRSSGIGEDGANYSFAGMAKTKLNRDKQNIYSDIKDVWESFFEIETIKYMIKSGQVVKPAVLIQEFVENIKSAGVIFSSDANGDFNIEIVRGVGEGLASGKIDPDRIKVFSKDGRIEYRRALNNKKKIMALPQGGIQIEKLENREKINRITNERDIRKMVDLVYALKQEVGYPVDVEFAIDEEDNIFILQRRPDTTFTGKINESEAKKELEETSLTVQSIADSFLSNIKRTSKNLYKTITVTVVPVVEELIFRFVPFFALSIIFANPLSIVPVIITSAVSIFAFSYAHTMADKLKAKKDKQTTVRDWNSFLIPSAIFTGLYVATFIAASVVLPGIGSYLIALAISTFGHSIYNKLVLEEKISNPVASVFEDKKDYPSQTIKQLKDDIANDRTKTVCFVCTGNTDRSPVSEMLFKSLMRKTGKKNIKVKSAGLYVSSSDWAMALKTEHRIELKKYNVDDDILDSFQTEKLSKEHLQSDYFIVVGKWHKQELINIGIPEEKIIMFSDLSPELVSGELPDPAGNKELKIQTIALINQIIENNFSVESLLKEPEEIKVQDIDMVLVTELITSLKSITGYRLKDSVAEIIDVLSQITQDTSAEKKNDIIFEQLTALSQIFKDPRDLSFLKLVPLATIIKNPQTNKTVLNEFIELLIKEKEKIDSVGSSYSEMWVNNQYSNFKSSAFKMFEVAYPVNHENALGIIKMLQMMGFVDTKELPWGVRDTIKEFQDVRNYFMAIAEPGVDADMLKGLKKTIEMLNNITLSDSEMNTEKESVIRNLSSLFEYINPSTAQIVDHQMQKLLLMVSNLLKNSKTEESALIIKSLLPVGEKLVSKTKILSEKTLRDLFAIAEKLYNMNEKESSAIIVSYLLFVAKSSDFEDSTRTNERACEYVAKITNTMYNSIKNLEKNNDEYIKTSNKILEMFRYLAENSPDDIRVYRELFDNLGFNTETVSVLITALEKSDKSASPYVPDDQKITNSNEIIDLIIKSRSVIVIERLCLKLYTTGENGKQMALSLIAKLFKIAEDKNENIELRKRSAVLLGRMSALMYKYVNDDNIMSIEKINNLYKELKIDSLLQESTSYIENIYGRSRYNDDSHAEKFDFTPLSARLPQSIVSKNQIRLKSPVYMENRGHINRNNKKVLDMIDDFDSLQDLLRHNIVVLERIKKLNDRATRKDFDKIVEVIVRMIELLKKIDIEHGNASEIALNNILKTIPSGKIDSDIIKKQVSLSKWETDTISDIEELHTLINAIHQTSILDFKQKIKDMSNMDKENIRTAKFTRDDTNILAYDLSDSTKINRDIQSFLTRLASDRVSIDDFVFRDDILVWTTRLFAHSVDIFINFGEKDRGISIYYNENGRRAGYAERVRYFSEVLKKLGFNVESDTEVDFSDKKPGTCGLKAVINKDSGLNEETDIVEIASKAILLYKHSTNLDMELEDIADRYSEGSYLETLAKLVDKFMAGEIWYGYSYVSNGRTAFREHTITERFSKPSYSFVKQNLDEILIYLGLEKMPDVLPKKYHEFEQSVIDKYFNAPIEQAYDEGRIILDENGYLVKNQNYDMMKSIINVIEDNEEDTLRQSRIINLISRSKFNFKTSGFIGNLMFVTGSMKLSDGESLSVMGLMNPYTRRLKYAMTEVISSNGRKRMGNKALIDVLNIEGYKVNSKQQLIGQKERTRIKSFLNAQMQNTDSPEILCTGTSDGKGIYVAGNITLDRKNVGHNDILLVPFTTPDDVKAIESAKAVITTGGGILSHAAITTRELKKPSVVLNGADWKDESVEATYYTSVNGIENIDGFQVRKVKENIFPLKQGTKILVNGETGRILMFNDIDTQLLEELQGYIDTNDIEQIKIFIDKNKDNKNIRRLVEYIYFQTIGNKESEDIMFVLFDEVMPEVVKEKIKELNGVYVQDKIRNISESIENIKHINNINIEYGIIARLNSKLNFIRTIGNREDMESLKKDVTLIQMDIKDKLLKYVLNIIQTGTALVTKNKLNSSDIAKIVKLLHQVTVFRYFIPKTETRKELLDARSNLEVLVGELENIVKDFQRNKKVQINSEICNFNEISIEDNYRFGSKTTELATMYKLLQKAKGVKVPPGVGISSNVLEMFFDEIGRGAEYKKLSEDFESAIQAKDLISAKKIAKDIQNLIDESKTDKKTAIQKVIENKIKYALQHGSRYSVRSSGVGEDSGNKAFAGMGETKLNVGYDDIFSSIEECWKSFYSDRCIDYMIESGQVVKPAVLIQEMINVDKAGVIFSRNKYGNTTIEALYGLGEGIVSGTLTPDTLEVDTASGEIIEYSVADKYVKIIATETGTKQEIVTEGAKERVLDVPTVKRLMDVVKTLEKDAGYPVDIEYGIKDDDIYILQRRPITTIEDTTQEQAKEEVVAVDEKPAKQMATIVFENISADQEILFNIANPNIEDEAIPVYLKKTDGNISVFCIDSKYNGKIDTGILLSAIVNRINTDIVVRDKFNSNLSIIAGIGEMEMGILPFHYIDSDKKIIPIEQDINIQHIKTMLMSA